MLHIRLLQLKTLKDKIVSITWPFQHRHGRSPSLFYVCRVHLLLGEYIWKSALKLLWDCVFDLVGSKRYTQPNLMSWELDIAAYISKLSGWKYDIQKRTRQGCVSIWIQQNKDSCGVVPSQTNRLKLVYSNSISYNTISQCSL